MLLRLRSSLPYEFGQNSLRGRLYGDSNLGLNKYWVLLSWPLHYLRARQCLIFLKLKSCSGHSVRHRASDLRIACYNAGLATRAYGDVGISPFRLCGEPHSIQVAKCKFFVSPTEEEVSFNARASSSAADKPGNSRRSTVIPYDWNEASSLSYKDNFR
jgi:hypothetical protein